MSTILPWENEEEQNYTCVDKIVNDIVREGLRCVFKQEWNSRYQASFGAWDDTSASGQHLFHLEKNRSRPNKKGFQAAFQHGDTNQWDCSVLFDAILYSKSIGQASLNPVIIREVNELREIRNEVKHIQKGKLTNTDFKNMTTRVENAFNSLGLSTNEVNRIKVERNRYKSFQALPPKPLHEVVYRSEKIHKINQDLQKLYSDNGGKMTYFYISGNPGSGKSQLARQVCEDIFNSVNWQTETSFVMTLDGKDLSSLLYSYQDFCRRLNCKESVIENVMNSSKPEDIKIKELRSQLGTRITNWKRWWIIVDNIENLAHITPLLPQIGDDVWNNGQIILTTQDTNCVPFHNSFTQHVSLSVGMDEQECRQLLSLLSKTDDSDPLLDEVADKLDRQPLAMAAAAWYMSQVIEPNVCPQFSWKDYLEKLEKGKIKFAEKRFLHVNPTYSFTMSTAVMLAVEKSAERNIIFNYVFQLFSFISFEPMSLGLIVQYVQQQDEHLDAEDILLEIKDCSLFLPVENADPNIRLHRVVHEAIKVFCHGKRPQIQNMARSENLTKGSIFSSEGVIQSVVKTLYFFKDRSDQVRLLPHLIAFTTAVKKLFPGNEALYSICLWFPKHEISEIYLFFGKVLHHYCSFNIAMEFHNANLQIWKDSEEKLVLSYIYQEIGCLNRTLGDLEKAENYIQQALEIQKEQLGPNHVDVAASYNNLGIVYSDSGEQEKAKEHYQWALNISKEQSGPKHVDVASCYNNLGILYSDTGDLKKAIEYHQGALEIQKEQLGPQHLDIAASYNNLGAVYNDNGEQVKAKECYQLALDIRKEQLGPKHVDVAASYNNLGILCSDTGDLEKAIEYHQCALEIEKEQLDPKHVDVATSYNNLGAVYNDTGELEKAKEYYLLALDIRKEQLGVKHVDVAASYNNLGILYSDTGDPEKAIEYYHMALKIEKEQFGPNNIEVAATYSNLGTVYNDRGDLEKAKEYYLMALDIRKEQLGLKHVDVAASYTNLGILYSDTGDLKKAIEYYHMALEIEKEQLVPNNVDVAATYHNLGKTYRNIGDLEKARECHQRALEIRKEKFGPNHVYVSASYDNLGTVERHAGDLEKAKEYHQLALEIRKKQLDANHVDIAASYYKLAWTYQKTGDLEKAKECHQRVLEIRKEKFGPNHVDVAASYDDLGAVHGDAGDLEKSKEYYQMALEIKKEHLGANHIDVAVSYDKLAIICEITGDREKAKEYFEWALEVKKKHANVGTS